MRLHRLLAVLVIALSFNVAASKDARADFYACYELLSAHDKNDEFQKELYQLVIRGWVRGLTYGVGYWWWKQEKNKYKELDIKTSSLENMSDGELYYTLVRDCRNEPSQYIDKLLLHLYLGRDVEK